MKSTYSTVSNSNRSLRHPIWCSVCIQYIHHIEPIDNFPKYHVVFIQPRRQTSCDIELGIIGVGSTIRHGKHIRCIMLMNIILIKKSIPIYALPTRSVAIGYVTALQHKPLDNSMKSVSSIMKIMTALSFSFFPGAKTFKIFRC